MKYSRVLAIGLLAAAAGCGGDGGDEWTEQRPAIVSAEGVLTHNGAPVEGATVVLAPEATGANAYGASAVTGPGGEFSLSAFPPEEGAVPGKYQVGVTKLEAPQTAPAAEGAHDERALPPPKNLLPEKYADPTKSGLTVEIPEGGTTDLKIELQ